MSARKTCGILLVSGVCVVFSLVANAASGAFGQSVKQDTKVVGRDIGHGARDVGHATAHVAKSIGHGAKQAGHGIAHGAREGWDATKQAVKQVFHKGD